MTTRHLLALAVAAVLFVSVGAPATPAAAGTAEDVSALASPYGNTRTDAANRLVDAAESDGSVLTAVTDVVLDANKPARQRVEAIRVLGRIGREASVRPLVQVVNSQTSAAVRTAAVLALAGIDNPNARNAIAAAAMNADALVRLAGIEAAAQAGVVEALPALVLAIKARAADAQTASTAMLAAGAIIARRSPPEAATAEARALMATLAAAPEGTPIVIWQSAALALGAFRHPDAVAPLLRVIREEAWSLDAAKRIAILKDARREQGGEGEGGEGEGGESGEQPELPDNEEEAAIRKAGQYRDMQLAPVAAQTLAGYGAGIYPDVYTTLLLDTQAQLSEMAFGIYARTVGGDIQPRMLASLSTLAKEAREAAERRNNEDSEDGDGNTNQDAIAEARAKARAHARDALRANLRGLLATDPQQVLAFRDNGTPPVIGLQPDAVVELAIVLEGAAPGDGDSESMAVLGVQCPQAVTLMLPIVAPLADLERVPASLTALRDSLEVRRAVMSLFAAMSVVDEPGSPTNHGFQREIEIERIIPPAVARVNDPDEQIRESAIEVLENRVAGSKLRDDALAAVTEQLPQESSQALLGRLARLLTRLSRSEAVKPVIELLARVQDPGPRAQLLAALTDLPPQVAREKEILKATELDLTDANKAPELRIAAARVMGWLGTPDAVDLLDRVLANESIDHKLRVTILEQVVKLRARASSMLNTLVGQDNRGGVLATLRDMYVGLIPATPDADTAENENRRQDLGVSLKKAMEAVAATGDERAAEALLVLANFHHAALDTKALSLVRDLPMSPQMVRTVLPKLIDALDATGVMETQKDSYRGEVLDVLAKMDLSRSPLSPKVGNTVRKLELALSSNRRLALSAIALLGKVGFTPALPQLNEAWATWKDDPAMRKQISDSAKELNPNWKEPADAE